MIGVGLFLMFSTWINIEHGSEIPSAFDIVAIVSSFMLCVLYDIRTWK
jgi:hypothetical protein